MLYAICGEDVPNSLEKRMSVRSEHLKRLQLLQEAGRKIGRVERMAHLPDHLAASARRIFRQPDRGRV